MSTTYTVRVLRGLSANLPASAPVGQVIFTTDTQKFYVGAGLTNPLDGPIGGGSVGPMVRVLLLPLSMMVISILMMRLEMYINKLLASGLSYMLP